MPIIRQQWSHADSTKVLFELVKNKITDDSFLTPEEWHSTWGSAILNLVDINKNQLISEAEMCYL